MSEGVTQGTLLGGSVLYRQPAYGYRTGLEPILLAASIPACPGERVLEGGTGAGAGLLALTARVPGLEGLGLEIDAAQVAIGRENLLANGRASLRIDTADLESWLPDAVFDHAFANPPWHDPASTPSPSSSRKIAKQSEAGQLARWSLALARGLKRRGTLSLILPATSLGEGIAALQGAACPEITLHPIWRREGEEAGLIILCGVRLGRGGCSVLPGLVLHGIGSDYTREAQGVLRATARLGETKASPPDPPPSVQG